MYFCNASCIVSLFTSDFTCLNFPYLFHSIAQCLSILFIFSKNQFFILLTHYTYFSFYFNYFCYDFYDFFYSVR